ncbi:MAG: hypothetical protein SGJ11_12010 [Phycisphaerae bacterium]|nr:hypothetical protein [Phycisphaerae bacterium]
MTHHRRRASLSYRHRCRGTAYVLAVGLSLLLAAVATGSLLASQALMHAGRDQEDVAKARVLARSGLAWGLAALNRHVAYAGGTVPSTATLSSASGRESLTATIANSAPAVGVNEFQPAVIDSTATVGLAQRRIVGQAIAVTRPYSAFQKALAVGKVLTVTSSGTVSIPSGEGIAAQLDVAGGGTVAGDVEQSNAVGNTVKSAADHAAKLVAFPEASAIDTLIASGTTYIIPTGTSAFALSRLLASPRSNPTGTLNTSGIYVVNCAGRRVSIANCRVAGTLILLDPGAGSFIGSGIVFEPAVHGYPTLIVRGNMTFSTTSTVLSESSGTNVNFAPQGTPYPFVGGGWDTDTSDTYTPGIDGMVFVTGDAVVSGRLRTATFVVCGNLTVSGTLITEPDPWCFVAPAPGFTSTTWQLKSGSVSQPLPAP